MKPILLHGHATSPNPQKVAIALEYLEIPYDIKIWDLSDDSHRGVKGEDFAKLSPNGRVPVIEDPNTGVQVWESGAIINYLKRQYDSSNILGPRGSSLQGQADIEQWEHLLVTTIAPMTGQMTWYRYYNLQKNDDALDRYIKQVIRYYDVVEGQLSRSGGKSILPGGISSVDCHYEPWLSKPDYLQIDMSRYPLISRWLELMAKEEAVKNAYEKIRKAALAQNPDEVNRSLVPERTYSEKVNANN